MKIFYAVVLILLVVAVIIRGGIGLLVDIVKTVGANYVERFC